MPKQHTDDLIKELVTKTELSLAYLSLLYYYTVHLPEQRQKLTQSSIPHQKTI